MSALYQCDLCGNEIAGTEWERYPFAIEEMHCDECAVAINEENELETKYLQENGEV